MQAALLSSSPTGQLNVSMIPPIKITETFTARNITEPQPGKFVFDFGQNMVCSLFTQSLVFDFKGLLYCYRLVIVLSI